MTSLNILLADDDSLVRAVMAEEIEDAGHRVRSVRGGLEALAALGEDQYDIFLVDYAMPGMMGVEAARQARARFPHLPIAILTGYGELLEVSGRNGEFPVIPKGRMDSILNAILAVAGGEDLPPVSSPESRWEEIQKRMAVSSNTHFVGETIRSLYAEPPSEPLPERLEALLGAVAPIDEPLPEPNDSAGPDPDRAKSNPHP